MGAASRPSTAGRRRRIAATATGARSAAQVLVRRPAPAAVGLRLRAARPGAAALDARGDRARSPSAARDRLPAPAGRAQPPPDRPRDRARRAARRGRRARRALRAAGWRPASPIQPDSTRVIDLRADEAALWGDLRKKWRQYVNKARTERHPGRRGRGRPTARVLRDLPGDGGAGRVPDPRRAGLPRRVGRVSARPAARGCCSPRPPTGEPQAALFLVRCGTAGRRALRRHDRGRRRQPRELPAEVGGDPSGPGEQGAETYDLWGLATPGIAHFKTGFGGREVRYIGAWDLVLDPLGRADVRDRPARPRLARAAAPRAGRRRAASARRGGADGAARDDATSATVAERARRRTGTAGGRSCRAATSSSRSPGPSIRRASGWRPRYVAGATHRVLALVRPWPWSAAAAPTCPRGPVPGGDGRETAADRLDRPPPLLRGRRRSTSSRSTPRSRPRCGVPARCSRGAGSTRSRRSSRRATGSRSRSPAPTRTRCSPGSRRRRASGSARRKGTGIASCATTRTRLTARRRSARPTDASTASTASTTCCSRPANGAASRSARGGVRRLVERAHAAGQSSISRPAPGARRRRRSAGSSCTATATASRPSTRATAPRAARDHPGAMHLLRWRAIQLAIAEGRARDGPRRRRRRRARDATHRGRADVSACTSTSDRSAPSGWSSPAPTSASHDRCATRAGRALAAPSPRRRGAMSATR